MAMRQHDAIRPKDRVDGRCSGKIITPRENAGFAERPHRCESIVEIFIRNNQTSKGKSGKDMKKQPLQRTNM